MLPIETARQVVAKWLVLDDLHIVDILLATVIANLSPGDPVWLLLVGPASSAKSELLRNLYRHPRVGVLGNLTPHTFISGGKADDESPSLLLQLPNPYILVMKDFGTILAMRSDDKAEILHQLREIYDGHLTKSFGTGKTIHWKGKIGFLGAVTPAIERHTSVMGELGERFLFYRVSQTDRRETGLRALLLDGKEDIMRQEISEAFLQALTAITSNIHNVSASDQVLGRLIAMADLSSRCRSPVTRNPRSNRIISIPIPEGVPRIAKQLFKLCKALAVTRGRDHILLEDVALVGRVALNAIPSPRWTVLRYLLDTPGLATAKDISASVGLPLASLYRILGDLAALQAIRKEYATARKGRPPELWQLTPESRQTYHETGI